MYSFIIKSKKHGEFTVLIDEEDRERVAKHGWSISKNGNYFRVETRTSENKLLRLHRFILNLKRGDPQIDHINGNTMDNRKCNLRTCTQEQNNRNLRGYKTNCKNKTGYFGVYQNNKNGKYRCCVSIKNKTHHISGNFDSPKEAAIARDAFVKEHFPEFGVLNFEGNENV